MSSFTKCTAKKGGYSETQCKALKSIVTHLNSSRAKGLFYSNVIDLETTRELGVAILIKSEQAPRGLYLNFCPFCGGELRYSSEDGGTNTVQAKDGEL